MLWRPEVISVSAGMQWLTGTVPLARLISQLSELTLIFVSHALLLTLDAHSVIQPPLWWTRITDRAFGLDLTSKTKFPNRPLSG